MKFRPWGWYHPEDENTFRWLERNFGPKDERWGIVTENTYRNGKKIGGRTMVEIFDNEDAMYFSLLFSHKLMKE